jgi:hypothetical protein
MIFLLQIFKNKPHTDLDKSCCKYEYFSMLTTVVCFFLCRETSSSSWSQVTPRLHMTTVNITVQTVTLQHRNLPRHRSLRQMRWGAEDRAGSLVSVIGTEHAVGGLIAMKVHFIFKGLLIFREWFKDIWYFFLLFKHIFA